MNPDYFLRSLHADHFEPKPPDSEIDWDDAPLTYKLYRSLPTIPLSPDIPLSLYGREPPTNPELAAIGHMLWHTYGLVRLSEYAVPADFSIVQTAVSAHMYRRFVPSGGGLYPNELYVYLKTADAPAGIYHYDAAHHRLVLLREGQFDSYLTRALGGRSELSGCAGAVFVSVMFWKNFYKYNNFAYRLQGLDSGVLIGQWLEAAKRFGYESAVHVQFVDRAVNHLLGLSEREESVYAVIPFSTEPATSWFRNGGADGEKRASGTAVELCRELPVVRHEHYVRSRNIKEYPLLVMMNEASMLDSTSTFRRAGAGKYPESGLQTVYMPRVERLSYDFGAICRKRYSPESDFVLSKVTRQNFAALLQEASASMSFCSDWRKPDESLVSLYCCLYNVEGIPNGAYRYDRQAHLLRRVRPGDHRLQLQTGMSLGNVNLFQVPLCVHVVGDKDYLKSALGYRGYRIQQMEAGMLVQSLLLAASAVGMGGRPLLGFSPAISDGLYRLREQGQTSLIQLPIGHYRQRSRLEGSLHS